MSVGQDFDRSILERKDRAALLAIAESLGAKASSRAKKADIVDAILAAAGHAGDDAAAPEPEAGPEVGPEPEATAAAAVAAEEPALMADDGATGGTTSASSDLDAGDDDADEARPSRDRSRGAANGGGDASNGAAVDVDDRHDEDGNQRRDPNEGNRAPDPHNQINPNQNDHG